VERLIGALESVAVGREGVALVRANGSPRGGRLLVEFTPEGGRTAMPWIIYEELTQRAVLVGGTDAINVQPPEGQGYYNGSGGSSGGSRRIKILGYSFEGVRQVALDLQGRLEQIARVRDVNINAASWWGSQGQSSISLQPDREKLGQVGASSRDFALSVAREIRSGEAGQTIEFDDDELPVAVRALGVRERQFDQLREAYVSNPQRAPIQIDDVAEVGEVVVLAEIQREDQQYLRIVSYDFRGPPKLAERTHKAFMATISVPRGYTVDDSYFGWEPDDSGKGLYLV